MIMKLEAVLGYQLVMQQEIPDIHSKGYLLKHKKSGARVMVLENDDNNKVFNIAFRTPPADSTGVAHILEHSVLCGSEHFPLKDPFVELVKGPCNPVGISAHGSAKITGILKISFQLIISQNHIRHMTFPVRYHDFLQYRSIVQNLYVGSLRICDPVFHDLLTLFCSAKITLRNCHILLPICLRVPTGKKGSHLRLPFSSLWPQNAGPIFLTPSGLLGGFPQQVFCLPQREV